MLYLVDKPNSKIAAEVAKLDDDAKIVLIKDGVYLDAATLPGKVYALN